LGELLWTAGVLRQQGGERFGRRQALAPRFASLLPLAHGRDSPGAPLAGPAAITGSATRRSHASSLWSQWRRSLED